MQVIPVMAKLNFQHNFFPHYSDPSEIILICSFIAISVETVIIYRII